MFSVRARQLIRYTTPEVSRRVGLPARDMLLGRWFAVMRRRDARYESDSCSCLPQCGRGVGTTHGGDVAVAVRETGGYILPFGDMRLERISIYVCNALEPMRA